MDAAATEQNALCARYLDEEIDSLRTPLPWGAVFKCKPGLECRPPESTLRETVWLNPPYSMAGPFVRRAMDELLWNNHTVVCLVYSKTDTAWFCDALKVAKELRLIKGRLQFTPPPGVKATGARTPSCVLVLQPRLYSAKVALSVIDRDAKPVTSL